MNDTEAVKRVERLFGPSYEIPRGTPVNAMQTSSILQCIGERAMKKDNTFGKFSVARYSFPDANTEISVEYAIFGRTLAHQSYLGRVSLVSIGEGRLRAITYHIPSTSFDDYSVLKQRQEIDMGDVSLEAFDAAREYQGVEQPPQIICQDEACALEALLKFQAEPIALDCI